MIFHHTATHAPTLDRSPTESHEDAVAYAKAIQTFHMDVRHWNDSGHNFLVARNGDVLEGRHGSVAAIRAGRMIVSAHCPGQNDQPGIEHEHEGSQELTPAQREASIELHVWIMQHTRIRPTEIYAHRRFFPTDCPGRLADEIPGLRLAVAKRLTTDPYSHIASELYRWFLWRDRGAIPAERPLARVRRRIPAAWWVRYAVHRGTPGL